eukprot:GSMAST32.ASY1.ANO1.305.1 assembled CDS
MTRVRVSTIHFFVVFFCVDFCKDFFVPHILYCFDFFTIHTFVSLEPDAYYPNNFNDFASGLVTLFELLVVNNWFIIMDGFAAATGSDWSRWFFISCTFSS